MVPARKVDPRYLPSLEGPEKLLARSEGWHPDVVAARRQATATKAGRENPKTVSLSTNRAVHRFGVEHQFRIFALP